MSDDDPKPERQLGLDELAGMTHDEAVNRIMHTVTKENLRALVEWSLAITMAAKKKGWGQEQSLAEWISQQCGAVH